MMKTAKEIAKRERQKRRRRGDYDRIDRFMCNSNFLWNQSLSQLQGRGIKSVKEKEIKVTPKSITHKQTDI